MNGIEQCLGFYGMASDMTFVLERPDGEVIIEGLLYPDHSSRYAYKIGWRSFKTTDVDKIIVMPYRIHVVLTREAL